MLKKIISNLLTFSFICYMILLIYFLFFSEEYGRDTIYSEYKMNLQLFAEIRRYLVYRDIIGWKLFAINIIGNVVVFIPFGFLLPVMYREQRRTKVFRGHYLRSFFFVIFLGFTLSFGVETVQLVSKVGCFDVDDLFLNTVGVMLGYLCYYICKKLIGGFFKQK